MRKANKVLVCLLVLAIILSLCACGNSKAIQNRLSEFENACRNLDLNTMLNCIDPSISKPIQLGLALYGMVADSDVEDTLDDLIKAVFGEDYKSSEFLSKLAITEPEIKQKGSSAEVNCKVSFELSGQNFTEDAIIRLVETDDIWYISGISFSKN